MTAIALEANKISKRFRLRHRRPYMLRDLLFLRPRRMSSEILWAVHDVSFHVEQGETVGIIGHNGAGKSTLMSLLGGVMQPTTGEVHINGRIGVLLELGTGFHPDLTGRENILLNASLHGMSRREVLQCFDDIVAFSELEEFLDTPIRNYSTGMHMRLAFSVAIQMRPDILIVDEILAVGDHPFQAKCGAWMDSFRSAGHTLLLVSHNLETVQSLCSRVIWMEHGRVRMVDAPNRVVAAYRES